MVGWHHQLNGHEFEQALGVGEQGSLMGSQSQTGLSDGTEQSKCYPKSFLVNQYIKGKSVS